MPFSATGVILQSFAWKLLRRCSAVCHCPAAGSLPCSVSHLEIREVGLEHQRNAHSRAAEYASESLQIGG